MGSLTLNQTSQIVIFNTNFTITGQLRSILGAVTLVGSSSVLTVGEGLHLSNGVLTGSGTIVGNVSVSGQSEIDVLEVDNRTYSVQKTGNLLIEGNLTLKRRDPSLDASSFELNHATVALGLVRVAAGKSWSRLRVTGRTYIELMSISFVQSLRRQRHTTISSPE